MTNEDLAALIMEELALIRQESRQGFKEQGSRLRSLEKGQEQILERSAPLERAFDKDSVTLQSHEKRIKRLEVVCLKR